MIKSIKLNLDENNDIQSVEVEDINNKIEHYFNEETDEEKEEYYNSTLRDIIKDYVDYLERIEYAITAYFRGNVKLIDNGIFELQKPEQYLSIVNKEEIQKLGAKGIVEIDNQLKIILGPNSKVLKKYIEELKK